MTSHYVYEVFRKYNETDNPVCYQDILSALSAVSLILYRRSVEALDHGNKTASKAYERSSNYLDKLMECIDSDEEEYEIKTWMVIDK